MLTKNAEKSPCQIWQKCYHFVIILLSSSKWVFTVRMIATSYVMWAFGAWKISCWNLAKCYHCVIIVIDNIFNKKRASWCLFLSFFWAPKMTFCHLLFCVTIMLSFFLLLLHKIILLYFDSICTRVEKILRKWTRIDVQKWDRRNTFGKIRRALGNLRNFFRTLVAWPQMLSLATFFANSEFHLAINCNILSPKPAFWGLHACPKIGDSYFQKTTTPVLGTWARGAFF